MRRPLIELTPISSAITPIERWTQAKILTNFHNLLNIFRPLQADTGPLAPENYALVIKAIKRIIYMLHTAYETADYREVAPRTTLLLLLNLILLTANVPTIPILTVFGPYLYYAAFSAHEFVSFPSPLPHLHRSHLAGKALAYKALCRHFVRHSQERFAPRVWARFYDALRLALVKHTNTDVTRNIIRTAVPLFSLDLPGVNLLLPYVMREIGVLLTNLTPQHDHVRECCLLVLASLVAFSTHFADLEPLNLTSSDPYLLPSSSSILTPTVRPTPSSPTATRWTPPSPWTLAPSSAIRS